MNYTYRVCTDSVNDENGKTFLTFGIALFKGQKILKYFPSISIHRERVLKLVDLCNRFDLNPIHIEDVIEDFFFVP